MGIRLHRPRTAAGKSATILGLYLTGAAVFAVLPFTGLSHPSSVVVGAVVLTAAYVVGQQLVRYRVWLQLVGALAALAVLFTLGRAVSASYLAANGERTVATVTDVTVQHGLRGTKTYAYTLVDWRGLPIPGHLSILTRRFRTGDRVRVVVDWHGRVAPERVGDVDVARTMWITALLGLALLVGVAILGGRLRVPGKEPEPGPFGLWIVRR